MEKLLAHPLLDGGQALNESDSLLVSIAGGPDLTMSEIEKLMEPLNRQCENAHIIFGAAIDEAFAGRLSVTLIASRRRHERSRPRAPRHLAADNVESHAISGHRPPRDRPAFALCRPAARVVGGEEGATYPAARRPVRAKGSRACKRNCRWKSSSKAVSRKASQPSATAKTWTCRPTSGAGCR